MESSGLVYHKVSRNLGLSEYEARVYVSLVIDGVSGARKLSLKCGVPRTKIYATLKKLMERGLVFELPEMPRKFASISPAKAFKPYLEHSKHENSDRIISFVESDEVVGLLEEAFKKTKSTFKPRREEVWIVQSKFEIVRKLREILTHAKKSVNVVTTENGFIWFCKNMNKCIDKLVENGVDVQIGTPTNSRNNSIAREFMYLCNVIHVEVDSPFLWVCIDKRVLFLAKLNSDDDIFGNEKNMAVVCSSSTLCDLFSLLLPVFE